MESSNLKPSNLDSVTAFSSSRWHEILSAVWMCIVFVGGISLNGFVMLLIVKNKTLRTGSNIYIIAMLGNNLMLCFAVAMPVVAEISGHWLQLMDMNACVAEAFIVYLFGLASMFVLVAIAISRYFAITRPFLSSNDDKLYAICAVCLSEFLALCFAVAPLLDWGSYGLEAHGTSCGLNWKDKRESAFSYLITITLACFIIPVGIMIFCYAKIYQSVRKARIAQQPTTRQFLRERKEANLLKLSVAFVSSFLISWIPYTVISFYVAYGNTESLDPMLSRSMALVAKSQVLWNPVLYCLISKDFRKEARKMFPCKCNLNASSVTVIRTNTNIVTISRLDHTTFERREIFELSGRLPNTACSSV